MKSNYDYSLFKNKLFDFWFLKPNSTTKESLEYLRELNIVTRPQRGILELIEKIKQEYDRNKT